MMILDVMKSDAFYTKVLKDFQCFEYTGNYINPKA